MHVQAIRRTNGEGEPYASKAFVTPLKTVAKVTAPVHPATQFHIRA